jgi:pimeloyl-ACP methyl ester carboxylesterase
MAGRALSRRRFLTLATSAAIAGADLGKRATAEADGSPRRAARSGHFVLVHGAWHGAWCWYKITPALEAAGHRVTALDLPSAGIDAAPPGSVTLQAQADRVITILDTLSEPVILVGHSAGGAVISSVAEARPDRIQNLVYLTAFLLQKGDSVAAAGIRDPGSLIGQHVVIGPDGTLIIDPSGRREVLYGECDARDVALAQSLLKPVGLRTTLDPVVVGNAFARVRRFYITCLRDKAISPGFQHTMYTALPCEKVFSIRSDHSPFLSHPAALLRHLAAIARA